MKKKNHRFKLVAESADEIAAVKRYACTRCGVRRDNITYFDGEKMKEYYPNDMTSIRFTKIPKCIQEDIQRVYGKKNS